MSNFEITPGKDKPEDAKDRQIYREDIPFEVVVHFQNKLAKVMAPDRIRPYLSNEDPQTDLEIEYANMWMNKYADPMGSYNGFHSFCNSPQVHPDIKQRLRDNAYTESDLRSAQEFFESESGKIFADDQEVQDFIAKYQH